MPAFAGMTLVQGFLRQGGIAKTAVVYKRRAPPSRRSGAGLKPIATRGIKVLSSRLKHRLATVIHAHGFAVALAGFVVTLCMAVLYIAQPSLISRLDLRLYDTLLPLRAAPRPSPVPVIINLDEASLAEYGQWPWSRYLVADLINALNDYQVAAIGLDILFAEADRSSPKEMRATLARDKGVALSFNGLPPELDDYDALLAEALAKAPAVLGIYGRFDRGKMDAAFALMPSISIIERSRPDSISFATHLQTVNHATIPTPALAGSAPPGLINVAPDDDGIVRQVPLLMRVQDKVYPSLALSTLMRGMETQNVIVESGADGLESVRVGDFSVPVSPLGAMRIPFIGPRQTYAYISARDVLRHEAPPEALEGRLAFVGTSVSGLLDLRATPMDALYPGVEIHAAAVDAILSQNAITLPAWTPGLQLLAILCSGLVATLAFGFARPRVYLPVAVALMTAVVMLSRYWFADGLFISPLYVLLNVAALGAALLFLRFWQEERQKLILRNAFSHYVSPEIVERITRERSNLFAGEERELSILFTDIRGFTSISEKLSPPQIVSLLNRYFTPMTALVRESSGTLDKFIGDALMAFWNAPLDVPRHPARAISTALAMQEMLLTMNEALRAEFGVELRIGAGIHTGTAYVGNMGSSDLVNYTLIGDNVNLASRLEGLCPQYGVGIVVSGETMAACGNGGDGGGEFAFLYLDALRVKGKTQAVTVYSPMPLEEFALCSAEIAEWNDACAHYRAGNFAIAATAFARLREQFPDTKRYVVYEERTRALMAAPPENWDGVWTLTSK